MRNNYNECLTFDQNKCVILFRSLTQTQFRRWLPTSSVVLGLPMSRKWPPKDTTLKIDLSPIAKIIRDFLTTSYWHYLRILSLIMTVLNEKNLSPKCEPCYFCPWIVSRGHWSNISNTKECIITFPNEKKVENTTYSGRIFLAFLLTPWSLILHESV